MPNTCITLAWLCGCDFISVWPFKRFLQGRGGREDNGSRHYLLLSCRLNVRPHTHCGPVLYGCQVNVPAHMLRHNVRTSTTRTDTHVQWRGDKMCACRARGAEVTHLRGLAPRQMHAARLRFISISEGAVAAIYAAGP